MFRRRIRFSHGDYRFFIASFANAHMHYSHYLQVTVLDNDRDIIAYLWNKDLSRADLYKRGTIGTFELTVSVDDWFRGKTKVYVADFKPDEKPQ